MKSGIELIEAERVRQIHEEGYTREHDHDHGRDDLARAAVCYAMPVGARPIIPVAQPDPPRTWPFGKDDWKPSPDDRVRELVKAGALIAAEIDRIQGNA